VRDFVGRRIAELARRHGLPGRSSGPFAG
jgi:hypothetical protein